MLTCIIFISIIAASQEFSLTQAQDWKMFQFMFSAGTTAIGSLLIMLFGLVGIMWKNLINRLDKLETNFNKK